MKNTELLVTVCPFCKNLISKQPPRIYCEGIQNKTSLCIKFDKIEDYYSHLETYCKRFNEDCYIYQLIMDKKYKEKNR